MATVWLRRPSLANHQESMTEVMEVSMQGKVRLVPAAAGGIGRATVVALSPFHPGRGWGPLCNTVIASDDMGEIVPEGSRVAALKYRSLAWGPS
jgi:hypothetical protein